VDAFGGKAVMTREDHPCGTNRCLEALRKTYTSFGANDVVINVQGDEPFIQPEQIELLKSCFPTDIATLVKPFTEEDGLEALKNPNSPKVVVAEGRAMYFSRSVIPYLRGVEEKEWIRESIRRGTPYYKDIGMYAYRASVLEQLVALPQSPLEKTESLEQLRWLEAGYAIRVAVTDTQTIGIDTPEDLARAEAYLRSARFL
jgi:3-deoxy-manno-octulosonate cytidylyltransferase (CMP-KDO synthetase)